MKFRNLEHWEVEVRVQSTGLAGKSKKPYAILLLYKDARCDMNILDETVGALNWKREHTRDNHNCIVSIWDKDKSQWISKEDTGSESFTEKEKGVASDSFKRACFNWGIGRELYSAPNIFVWLNEGEYYTKDQNNKTYVNLDNKTKFRVKQITISDNKQIMGVEIVDKENNSRFKVTP
jgi:hypothetical protein